MRKKCYKCGETKPLNEFYKDSSKLFGRAGTCISCGKKQHAEYYTRNRDDILLNRKARYENNAEALKEKQSQYRRDHLESVREYDRQRSRTDSRRAAVQLSVKKWAKQNPEKIIAQRKFNNAIKAGAITRSKQCRKCGTTGITIDGHHSDYEKPLSVIWVCRPCHSAIHQK